MTWRQILTVVGAAYAFLFLFLWSMLCAAARADAASRRHAAAVRAQARGGLVVVGTEEMRAAAGEAPTRSNVDNA